MAYDISRQAIQPSPRLGGRWLIEFVLDAEDVRHLNLLVQGLRRLPGVRDVTRSQKL